MIVWRFAQANSALNSLRSRLATLLPSDPFRRTRKEYSSKNSFCSFVNLSLSRAARSLASFLALRYFVKSEALLISFHVDSHWINTTTHLPHSSASLTQMENYFILKILQRQWICTRPSFPVETPLSKSD